ncbi:hypothetical protein EVAR_85804_1 [Eumeta japonica]|uniref:Uncharacterized protein n=1 Tax=Eumeta variegata TaxID=151549 RepID=A0A4C1UQ98_EUMVA|nr:hypothetical protein EVAR_85804_1 [Eumeta japonica]
MKVGVQLKHAIMQKMLLPKDHFTNRDENWYSARICDSENNRLLSDLDAVCSVLPAAGVWQWCGGVCAVRAWRRQVCGVQHAWQERARCRAAGGVYDDGAR